MLGVGEPARVSVHVEHAVPELLVVAVHFVDHLLRAADQRRAALDEVLQGGEHRIDAQTFLEGEVCLEHRPVRDDGCL